MPKKPRHVLSELRIEEIALCREGMNPEANILLYKRRDRDDDALRKQIAYTTGSAAGHSHPGVLPDTVRTGAFRTARGTTRHDHEIRIPRDLAPGDSITLMTQPGSDPGAPAHQHELTIRVPARTQRSLYERLRKAASAEGRISLEQYRELAKQDDDHEPREFREHLESSRLMEIDGALDRRLHALLSTTTEVMRSDVPDREARIIEAVNQYAETMRREVPELFAGRLAKAIHEIDDTRDEQQIARVVVKELDDAGLLPTSRGGGGVMFWKSLNERGQAALKFVLGDRDPSEVFKGVSEDVGKVLGGLFEKSAEWADRVDVLGKQLETAQAAVAKSASESEDSLATLLKSVEDPNVRAYIEVQAATVSKQGGEISAMRKAARRKDLEAIAKGLDCLPTDGLVDALEKADLSGILEPIEAALVAANAQARVGKAMAELGIDVLPGDGDSTQTRESAHAALTAKAAEIRKVRTDVTAEKAYEMACDQNPDLYNATRAYAPGTVGAMH